MSDPRDLAYLAATMAVAESELEILEAIQFPLDSAAAAIAVASKEFAECSELCSPLAAAASCRNESVFGWSVQEFTSAVRSGFLGECLTPARKSPRKRGRPIKISDERKQRAQALRAKGGSLGEAARILYNTHTPTRQQKSNASTILRVFRLKAK